MTQGSEDSKHQSPAGPDRPGLRKRAAGASAGLGQEQWMKRVWTRMPQPTCEPSQAELTMRHDEPSRGEGPLQCQGIHSIGKMADAITWRFVSQEQLALLAQRHSVDDCKSELAQIFKLDGDDQRQTYLLSCHLYTYSFARQQHFRADQTSVLLGILQSLMDADFAHESTSTIDSSYLHFQSLLLAHSVDRSPKSVQIFSPEDVATIVEFVAHSYYRHFHLYKCIFTPFYHTHLVQKHVDGVQLPSIPRPLSEAFLHPQEEPPHTEEEDSAMETPTQELQT